MRKGSTAGPHLICSACQHNIPLATAARTGNGKGRLATCRSCDVVYTWRISSSTEPLSPIDRAGLQ